MIFDTTAASQFRPRSFRGRGPGRRDLYMTRGVWSSGCGQQYFHGYCCAVVLNHYNQCDEPQVQWVSDCRSQPRCCGSIEMVQTHRPSQDQETTNTTSVCLDGRPSRKSLFVGGSSRTRPRRVSDREASFESIQQDD